MPTVPLMKALLVTRFGTTSALELRDLPEPAPGRGQVLIKVAAATVNWIDISTRNGNLAAAGLLAPAATYSLGWDVAGIVDAVGEGVDHLDVGDQVVALRDVLSDPGTQAEYVVLDASVVTRAPSAVPLEQAAGLPLAGLTALGSIELAGARRGDALLVTGASGAVGRIVVELAASAGVRVIAQGADGDRETLLDCGAEAVVGRDDDLPRTVRSMVPGGVDAVIDAAVLGVTAHEALRARGRFVALVAPFAPPALRGTDVVVQEVWADGGRLRNLVALLDAGVVSVRPTRSFALADAAAAHDAMEARGNRARIVLVP